MLWYKTCTLYTLIYMMFLVGIVSAQDSIELSDKPFVIQFFSLGSKVIDTKGLEHIASIAKAAQSRPQRKILVAGYTDDIGNDKAHRALSLERAKAVQAALIQQGVNPLRILVEGCGKANDAPEATQDSKSRRVEIQFADAVPLGMTVCEYVGRLPTSPTQQNPIRIGIAVAFTGPSAAWIGAEQAIGLRIAEQFFKSQGGVNGRPIAFRSEDTGATDEEAKEAFRKLIRQSIIAIVGPSTSQQGEHAARIADEQGIPVIGPSNTKEAYTTLFNKRSVFRVSVGVDVSARHAITKVFRKHKNIKTIMIAFASNNTYAISEKDAYLKALQDDKSKTVFEPIAFETRDTEEEKKLSKIVTQISDKKPDLIILCALSDDGFRLVERLRKHPVTIETAIIAGNGLNTPGIFKTCGDNCHNIFLAQSYNFESESSTNREFQRLHRQDAVGNTRLYPSQFTTQMFTAIQVIVDALRAVDTQRVQSRKKPIKDLNLHDPSTITELRNALMQELRSGRDFQTPLGEISFDKDGEIHQNASDIIVIELEKGSNGEERFKPVH